MDRDAGLLALELDEHATEINMSHFDTMLNKNYTL